MKRRAVVPLVVALAMVGCVSTGAGDGSAPPSAASPPPSSASGPACPDVDLRTQSGERLDLTGTWLTEREGARGGIYYVHQVGSCVWMAGGFDDTDNPADSPLSYVTVVISGQIEPDFTIVGEWSDVRVQFPNMAMGYGSLVLAIDADGSGEARLVYAGGQGLSFVEPGVREEQSWVKISDAGTYPPAP